MNLCEAKRGFFVLYDCKKESATECPGCNRNLCREHFQQTHDYCFECQANSESHGSENDSQVESYRLRRQKLSDSETKIFYFGTHLGAYYDTYDVRSFDMELGNIADMAESPDEIYFDS